MNSNMLNDMYKVFERINEIKSRFGLKRHNTDAEKKAGAAAADSKKGYAEIEKSVINKKAENGLSDNNRKISAGNDIGRIVDYSSKLNGVPSALVKSVILNESGYGVSKFRETSEYIKKVLKSYTDNK